MSDQEDPAAAGAAGELEPAAEPKLRGWHKRVDWPVLKAEYVEGLPHPDNPDEKWWPTYREVAERHDCHESSVKAKAADQGWREARAAYQTHIERVRQQKRAEAGAKELQDLDAGALRVAKTGVAVAQARLAQIAERVQQARAAQQAESVVDARELNQLAQAADLFHRIGLRSLGDAEGAIRHEVGGVAGKAIEIQAELRRDDPARLTGVIQVLHLAGLGDVFGSESDARTLIDASLEEDGRGDGSRPAIEAGR